MNSGLGRKKTAIVIFPGRGTYAKDQLGYLAKYHGEKQRFIQTIDQWRDKAGRVGVSKLDGAKAYLASKHASSLNASALIYACALADFAAIDREKFDVVAVCGNSLGWYLSLAASGVLNEEDAICFVDTMGALMDEHAIGGQLVYPLVDEEWRASAVHRGAVGDALAAGQRAGQAFVSIELGGMVVLAGDEAGLAAMEKSLPAVEKRYPFRLARHAAFHTPLLRGVAEHARAQLSRDLFCSPHFPLIDGRGKIWSAYNTSLDALYDYTLGHQIHATYSFSKSIEIAIKEFVPEKLILAGPGATLGAPIAQSLIAHRWQGIASRDDFMECQKRDPFLLAMGREDQRAYVV